MPQSRPPTPSEIKYDSSIQIYKTVYPYNNLKHTGLSPFFQSVKRIIAPYNPFAVQQIPSSDRMAVGMKYGAYFYRPDAYINGIHFDTQWPSHYNPFNNPRRKKPQGVIHPDGPGDKMGFQIIMLPRFCQRQIATYKRCLVANDDSAHVCQKQQDEILSVCPNFALDGLKQKKLTFLKIQAMNNKKYRQAMEVSSYNAGRTVANVPRKTWDDGKANKLRPDTMWYDDRYVDINQKEINQAKQRVRQRQQSRGHASNNQVHLQLIDRTVQKQNTKIPLYP